MQCLKKNGMELGLVASIDKDGDLLFREKRDREGLKDVHRTQIKSTVPQ